MLFESETDMYKRRNIDSKLFPFYSMQLYFGKWVGKGGSIGDVGHEFGLTEHVACAVSEVLELYWLCRM